MRIYSTILCVLGLLPFINTAFVPSDLDSISARDSVVASFDPLPSKQLEKRRGRGGGGSSSSGSSSGSSGSGKGSGTGGTSLGSSSSNTGGRTTSGSGISPSYAGGRYYGGGATTPYAAGLRSPLGISPLFIGAPILLLGSAYAFGGYGAYGYPYGHPYIYRNETSKSNDTIPVECVCAQYQECGCEDNEDQSYLDSVTGNGSLSDLNSTLARVQTVNGTRMLIINGTLPNGTTIAGGSESASAASSVEIGQWLFVFGSVAALALNI